MGVVDDPSDPGLLLLRLGRAGQTATPGNHRRFRRDPSKASKPSVLSSSAVSGPSLTLGFSNEADGGGSDEEEGGGGPAGGACRKKLRLTKEQSALLEDRFNEHSTLNPKQKLALAKQLNLRPRQVEVWFQNRRARTKLKQTEVDCEFLRRRCETLAAENRRLHHELQELGSLKLAAATPLYTQLPQSTLMVCPSCERVALGEADGVALARANLPPAMKAMMKKKTPLLKYS